MNELSFSDQIIQNLLQDSLVDKHDNSTNETSVFQQSALQNPYVSHLMAQSGLHINHQDKAIKLFEKCGHVGLMYLFLPLSALNSIREYTNEKLAEKGSKSKCNKKEFMAYVGLEIATSLVPLNQIRDYWRSACFSGHPDFKNVMSRDRFKTIRGKLILKADILAGAANSASDPLHSCRRLIDLIAKNFAEVAVPTGTCALDEASCRSKARNKAVSYMPSKPDRFAIRFYFVVGTKGPYIHSLWDNGRGNTSPSPQADRYNHLHKVFGAILNNHFGTRSIIQRTSASALWLCQLVHQTKMYRPSSGYRVVFTDNFYTRPRLAKKLFEVSDGDIKMTGTCKYPNIDAINRPVFFECVKKLKDCPRGTWLLARTYDYNESYDKERKRSGDVAISTYLEVPDIYIQDKSGFVFFKDSKVVVFYSNDLKSTPYDRICDSIDERSIEAVHGLGLIERWNGDENIGRTRLQCPAIIISYQMFMNGVDRVDQMRSTSPTKRKEMRIHMSIWTYMLDLAIHNAYCIYIQLMEKELIQDSKQIVEEEEVGVRDMFRYETVLDSSDSDSNGSANVREEGDNMTDTSSVPSSSTSSKNLIKLNEFKRIICEQLTIPFVKTTEKPKTEAFKNQNSLMQMECTVGTDLTQHVLLSNLKIKGTDQVKCHLCALRKGTKGNTVFPMSKYGCGKCGRGFHVDCFAAYHHRHALEGKGETIRTMINALEEVEEYEGVSRKKYKQRVSKKIKHFDDIVLPKVKD